jgi:hypothetical protein
MKSTFGSSRAGNGAALKVAESATKKSSPSSHLGPRSSGAKRNPLTAFTLDSENDARLAVKLRDKKLDRDIGNIDFNKAKISLLAQREAGEIERKRNEHQLLVQREAAKNERQREENQMRILQLQLQLQQGQQPDLGGVGDDFVQQPLFGNGNVGNHINGFGFNGVHYGGGN